MKLSLRSGSFVLLAGLAACGGSSPSPAAPAPAPPVGEHGHDHAAMPAEVSAFHDVLAPRWHLPADQARMDATCAATAEFTAAAAKLYTAPAPADVDNTDEAWHKAAQAVVWSVETLGEGCAGDLAAFDEAFTSLHEDFHALMELLQGGGA